MLTADAISNRSGSGFIPSVKVMEQKGADEKPLKCLPNVNANIGSESLLKAGVRRQSKIFYIGNKTRQCKHSLRQ